MFVLDTTLEKTWTLRDRPCAATPNLKAFRLTRERIEHIGRCLGMTTCGEAAGAPPRTRPVWQRLGEATGQGDHQARAFYAASRPCCEGRRLRPPAPHHRPRTSPHGPGDDADVPSAAPDPGRRGSHTAAGNAPNARCAAPHLAAVPPMANSMLDRSSRPSKRVVAVAAVRDESHDYWRWIAGGLMVTVLVADTWPRSGWLSVMVSVNVRGLVP